MGERSLPFFLSFSRRSRCRRKVISIRDLRRHARYCETAGIPGGGKGNMRYVDARCANTKMDLLSGKHCFLYSKAFDSGYSEFKFNPRASGTNESRR